MAHGQAVLADGQTYLAAAKSATAAPLYYSLMLPPDSQATSFQLISAVIVQSEDVLLTGYAADGRPPYTYVVCHHHGHHDVLEVFTLKPYINPNTKDVNNSRAHVACLLLIVYIALGRPPYAPP